MAPVSDAPAELATLPVAMEPTSTVAAAELQQFLTDAYGGAPVPFLIEEVTSSGVRIRYRVTEQDSRPGGSVSGPTLMTLADCAAWMAIASRMGPVALAVTTSLHIDFLRKPDLVDVVAVGELLKLGKRLAVAEVTMYSVALDAPVAKAQVTYSIPPT